jgi:hypothetical protein
MGLFYKWNQILMYQFESGPKWAHKATYTVALYITYICITNGAYEIGIQ